MLQRIASMMDAEHIDASPVLTTGEMSPDSTDTTQPLPDVAEMPTTNA